MPFVNASLPYNCHLAINMANSEKMVMLGRNGGLVIPAIYQKKMRFSEGDRLILQYEEGVLKIMIPSQGL